MGNIINADYQVVQERTLPVIISEIKTIEAQVYKTAINGAAEIGARLLEAKEQVGHGNWIAWCEENLNYTPRQAQNFIKIHETYGNENSPYANTKTSSHLSISKALALLQVPEEDMEKFEEEHDPAEMEDMTVRALKEEIEEWKKKNKELEEEQDDLVKQINEGESRRSELVAEIGQLKKNSADPKKIQELEKELSKEKAKIEQTREALKKEKETKEQAVQAAIEEKKKELLQEAETAQAEKVKAIEESKRAMEEQLAETKKKLKLSNNAGITAVKVKLDLIQKTFMDIDIEIENIGLEDKEQEGKLRNATKQILQSLIDRL